MERDSVLPKSVFSLLKPLVRRKQLHSDRRDRGMLLLLRKLLLLP